MTAPVQNAAALAAAGRRCAWRIRKGLPVYHADLLADSQLGYGDHEPAVTARGHLPPRRRLPGCYGRGTAAVEMSRWCSAPSGLVPVLLGLSGLAARGSPPSHHRPA